MFTVSLCSGKTAFEVKTHIPLDTLRAGEVFPARVATRHLTIIQVEGCEVSLYPSGRMLVKKVKTPEEALRIAEIIVDRLK